MNDRIKVGFIFVLFGDCWFDHVRLISDILSALWYHVCVPENKLGEYLSRLPFIHRIAILKAFWAILNYVRILEKKRRKWKSAEKLYKDEY